MAVDQIPARAFWHWEPVLVVAGNKGEGVDVVMELGNREFEGVHRTFLSAAASDEQPAWEAAGRADVRGTLRTRMSALPPRAQNRGGTIVGQKARRVDEPALSDLPSPKEE